MSVNTSSFAFDEKHDTAYGDNGAGNRSIGNIVLSVFRGMDGSNIHDFFACLKAERAPNDNAQTDDNKNNSGHLHALVSKRRVTWIALLDYW